MIHILYMKLTLIILVAKLCHVIDMNFKKCHVHTSNLPLLLVILNDLYNLVVARKIDKVYAYFDKNFTKYTTKY